MITYNPGIDGHNISKCDRVVAGLPILRQSTKRVDVANGSTSQAKHVTNLQFKQLSLQATQAFSFANFRISLMSVRETAEDGTISIFTKDGVRIHNKQDVLSTYKSKPWLKDIRDEHCTYLIPLLSSNKKDNGNQDAQANVSRRQNSKPRVCITYSTQNKPSKGCMQFLDSQSSLH